MAPHRASLVVAAPLLAATAACSSPSSSAPSTSSPSTSAPSSPSSSAPSATAPVDDFAYLDLATLALKSRARDGAPTGLHVRGRLDGVAFVATSDVEGDGALAAGPEGMPGYLELSTRRFMSAQEARAPTPPYVEGRMTPRGFVPTSRTVVK